MTHSDIKERFLIEYDKMSTTSSYPSLTDYEIAVVLDKAYLATIANKLTGNNVRKAMFESDNKAIEDVRPLITTQHLQKLTTSQFNEIEYTIPEEWMYFLQASVMIGSDKANVSLVSHEDATKFKQTVTNLPWIPSPVLYIEDDKLIVLYDKYKYNENNIGDLLCTFIKKPKLFTSSEDYTLFELNDNVAEEVINLAIIMSAEIVESQRMTTKSQINSVES